MNFANSVHERIIYFLTKGSMSLSIGYGLYTPVYCIPKDELGNAKRLWQAPLPNANSCEEVLNTPGIPGDIKPTKPNNCLFMDNQYYGIWIVNDNSCDNGTTLLWSDEIKESCNGFQLNTEAELDLYEYDRQYRPIIAENTVFINENGKAVYPQSYEGNKGQFEYADNICASDGKYWVKPNGELGYEYEGCGGNYNFKVTNVFEAKLIGATSCDDVFTTSGIKDSYPDVCAKREDGFYGIWSLYEKGNLSACPNKLEFKYMSNTCTNGQGYSWYKLVGTNKNFTPEENLAVAKSLKLKAWGYNLPIEPDQAYLNCNNEPVCGWNYGQCNGNPYPFTIFLIIIIIIVIIFLILAYLYLRKRFVAPVPMSPVATSTTIQEYVPVEIIQPICETVYVCEGYDCEVPQESCANEQIYTYREVERSVGEDYEITYYDQ